VELQARGARRARWLARDWVSPEDYESRLAGLGLTAERARRFIDDAVAHGLLERAEPGERAAEDERRDLWTSAGCSLAHDLLFARSHQPYLDYQAEETQAIEEELMAAYRAESAPPSIYKDCAGAEVTALRDAAAELPLGALSASAEAPRGRALTRAWLSALLRHAFGATGVLEDPIQGELLLKTHPSGGARPPHPWSHAGAGGDSGPAGVHHYSVRSHALERVAAAAAPEAVAERLFPGLSPALVVILTVMPERVMWRYREPASLCVAMLDLGHAAENFALACRCEGVACALHADPDPLALARDLSVPAFSELPLAALAVGARGGPS
jgi:hypothetical protein